MRQFSGPPLTWLEEVLDVLGDDGSGLPHGGLDDGRVVPQVEHELVFGRVCENHRHHHQEKRTRELTHVYGTK